MMWRLRILEGRPNPILWGIYSPCIPAHRTPLVGMSGSCWDGRLPLARRMRSGDSHSQDASSTLRRATACASSSTAALDSTPRMLLGGWKRPVHTKKVVGLQEEKARTQD